MAHAYNPAMREAEAKGSQVEVSPKQLERKGQRKEEREGGKEGGKQISTIHAVAINTMEEEKHSILIEIAQLVFLSLIISHQEVQLHGPEQ